LETLNLDTCVLIVGKDVFLLKFKCSLGLESSSLLVNKLVVLGLENLVGM